MMFRPLLSVKTFALAAVSLIVTGGAGCDPSDPARVDPDYSVPAIRSLTFTPTIIDTDSIFVGGERRADDIIPIQVTASMEVVAKTDKPSIVAEVRGPSGKRFTTRSSFNDAGVFPDQTASDGRFTGTIAFDVERAITGGFAVGVSVADGNGLSGNTLSNTLMLIRDNLPPVISNLEADTIVSLSGGNTTLQLRITAGDPNGLTDIQRVWFNAYRPDSSASSANPFIMYDDGNSGGQSGDITAGDGIYGLTIAFQGASLGTYRFSFAATDRFRDTSNVINHFLTVIP